MDPAAPPGGRRAGPAAALGLVGFLLLAPPVFLLGPLAALLALSRPATWRERIWLAAAAALTVFWLALPGTLPQQVVRAAAMGLLGGTVAVALSGRPAPAFRQAVTAALAAGIGTVLWAALLGTRFADFRSAVAADLRAGFGSLARAPGPATPEATALVEAFNASADQVAAIYPGMLLVLAVIGSMLAWGWLHRIAVAPVGPAPGRFRDFRFNDHWVWGAILTLAAWLAPGPAAIGLVAANLLIAWAALYLARGLAVVVAMVAGSPWPLRAVSIGVGVLLQPFSTGALVAIGLADTWMDFRRRSPPVPGGHDQ